MGSYGYSAPTVLYTGLEFGVGQSRHQALVKFPTTRESALVLHVFCSARFIFFSSFLLGRRVVGCIFFAPFVHPEELIVYFSSLFCPVVGRSALSFLNWTTINVHRNSSFRYCMIIMHKGTEIPPQLSSLVGSYAAWVLRCDSVLEENDAGLTDKRQPDCLLQNKTHVLVSLIPRDSLWCGGCDRVAENCPNISTFKSKCVPPMTIINYWSTCTGEWLPSSTSRSGKSDNY